MLVPPRHRRLQASFILALLGMNCLATPVSARITSSRHALLLVRDGLHAADVSPGTRRLIDHPLRNPMAGSTGWDSFESEAAERPFWDGQDTLGAFGRTSDVDRQSRAADTDCCPIVELRRYTLYPGKRDPFITLFEHAFIESQEALGIEMIAQFRDLDAPDVFVWLRGFSTMEMRLDALTAFYYGPLWKSYRTEANDMMFDSDNVRLLHPAGPGAGFAPAHGARPPDGATASPPGLVVATLYTLSAPAEEGFAAFFEHTLAPELQASGATPLAAFETEAHENTFPQLPVREGEHVFVWFAAFDDVEAYDRSLATLGASAAWRDVARPALDRYLVAPEQRWRLAPTARSRTLAPHAAALGSAAP